MEARCNAYTIAASTGFYEKVGAPLLTKIEFKQAARALRAECWNGALQSFQLICGQKRHTTMSWVSGLGQGQGQGQELG